MAKKKRVSSKTHTQAQLNDYANQHNPNNKAYKARRINAKAMRKKKKSYDDGFDTTLDWMCYGLGPYEFD